MRITQVVFVGIFVLENFSTHVAGHFIVRSVHIPQVTGVLRSTDVLITVLAVNFACKVLG